ncbi:hypothetical protein MMC26_002291 [Xylographa opegraphella]|nr:hypothetical protein [Xylographa opegraphella]
MATPVVSKRQAKRATILSTTGDIASNDRPKGLVRVREGILQHFLTSSEEWVPAMYHNDIREELIEESEAFGDYDHPRARGLGADDVTSFLPAQKTWGIERQYWPDVLFQIIPDKSTHLPEDNVKPWYRNGMILLDQDNRPLNDYDSIPATLSTEIEGQYMEAMSRLDSRIKHADFRARMPSTMVVKAGNPAVPLFTLNTISMRMSRFRDQAALVSREKRAGTQSIEDNLRQLLPEQCFEENSTRSFGRLLTREEVAIVKSVNKGKFAYRVRKGKAAVGVSGPTAPKRKRTRVTIENDDDEQNPDIHSTTPEQNSEIHSTSPGLHRAKRTRHAEAQEPDWSSVIDPTLETLTPWVPNNQNDYRQEQAPAHPCIPSNDDYTLESENAYSTNPSNEFALSISDDNPHDVSAVASAESTQGVSQLEMLPYRPDLIAGGYGNSLADTLVTNQWAAQNQQVYTGRLTHGFHRQPHGNEAAPTRSMSYHEPQSAVNAYVPYNIDFVTNTHTSTPLANNSQNTETRDDGRNGNWSLGDQPIFTNRNRAQHTLPAFNETVYSRANGQHQQRNSLDPADHAVQSTNHFELGRGDANGVIPNQESQENEEEPPFSFTDYLNDSDSQYDEQEFVLIGNS